MGKKCKRYLELQLHVLTYMYTVVCVKCTFKAVGPRVYIHKKEKRVSNYTMAVHKHSF